ncbi:MAG: hypothetical protein ACTHJN_09480 [Ginsengibacter sp.]
MTKPVLDICQLWLATRILRMYGMNTRLSSVGEARTGEEVGKP